MNENSGLNLFKSTDFTGEKYKGYTVSSQKPYLAQRHGEHRDM